MRLVVIDTTEKRAPFLSAWWGLGAAILSGADEVVRAATWTEAYHGIREALKGYDGPVDLQVWGHGDDGRPLIGGRSVFLPSLASSLGKRPKGTTAWFRSCEVARGQLGADFMERARDALDCVVVAHCQIISAPLPWRQRAICALRPGEAVWWHPRGEGLRGCSTFRMTVPDFAFQGAQ